MYIYIYILCIAYIYTYTYLMHHGGCSTCAGVDPAVTPTLCPLRGNHRVPTG